MAKITFKSLGLKENDEVKKFVLNGKEIEVKQSISASEKYDILMITLQQSEEDGIYNPFKLAVHFDLAMLLTYTNITLTDKQKEDMLKVYDILESNGVFLKVFEFLPDGEYALMRNWLNKMVETKTTQNNTVAGAINKFINDMPANAQAAADIVNNFNPDKYAEVINFAKGIGMR